MNPHPPLPNMLRALCLTTMARQYETVAEQAGREQWSPVQYLQGLCELEINAREQRRRASHLHSSRLPAAKTMATLELDCFPLKVRQQLPLLLAGEFVKKAENLLVFGLPGRGKSHLVCALARELLLYHDYRVLFTRASALVQELLKAKRDLDLDVLLRKLDRFDVVIVDDVGYVRQERAEMDVLFTFLAERYERKSLIVTSNLVFSQWEQIFKDPLMTAAVIDQLVHHAIILELDNDSYRARQAHQRQPQGGDRADTRNQEK